MNAKKFLKYFISLTKTSCHSISSASFASSMSVAVLLRKRKAGTCARGGKLGANNIRQRVTLPKIPLACAHVYILYEPPLLFWKTNLFEKKISMIFKVFYHDLGM
jgi:hypothetical protein